MIEKQNIILIGSAGRNVGKTEFACELISHYMKCETVIGIKITTVKEKDGKCPRGGEGCGVCSSLEGHYDITEEINGPAEKDTVRMLSAGAKKVYWLRVLKSYLHDGIDELLSKIPDNACIVCESNSARLVLNPGLFIVIKEKKIDSIKSSCQSVIKYADRIIDYNDKTWNVQPDEIIFSDMTWRMIDA